MTKLQYIVSLFYDKIVLRWPWIVITFLGALLIFLGIQAKNFKLDASAETLVLEHDEDLQYSRVINSRYRVNDYLLMTFSPKEELFSGGTLLELKNLSDELKQLERVSSVVTILDVPLLESPPVPIKELASNVRTLESPDVDLELARKEFKNSPLYQNLIVSPDLKTTALQINFPIDTEYHDLLNQRNTLRDKQDAGHLTDDEKTELIQVTEKFDAYRDTLKQNWHNDVKSVREIMGHYRKGGELFLGGVTMIADDLITFVKKDLEVFGLGVFLLLIVMLGIIFKQKRWIFLPMLCCAVSVIYMMGLLGMFGWEVTVISSNFVSLQLIFTMSLAIHLTVRYRELLSKNPETEQKALVLETITSMIKPCLYASLTTIAGFGSLVICDIRPVITFGWMMIGGITVTMIVTFLLFPATLVLMQKNTSHPKRFINFSPIDLFAGITASHGIKILILSCFILVMSVIGASRLIVENSFIDYFKKTTEIYQGMKVIDQNLGGTTPMDVIIKFDQVKQDDPVAVSQAESEATDEFDEFDEFEKQENDEKYWFTSDKMDIIKKVHTYLESIPETGKVLSMATMLRIAEQFNDGKPLDNFKLALLYSELPEKFKTMVLTPYVSIKNNEARISVRVKDSEKSLKRNELIKKIKRDLVTKLGLKKEQTHLTGMLVLYNDMLQSLFKSQIKTLGLVLLLLMGMFLVLFRSVKISLIAIFPNILSIGSVLGFMGWMNIPLDMMTITIASISVGIAVDDTIHYIHRFRHEFTYDKNYLNTLHRCHKSIGHAMYYTSITIIIGFSILALSNFIPSIYFGLLTGLAMLIALVAALTLLPELIVFFKPFGPEAE